MPPDPTIPPAPSDDFRTRSVWTEAPLIAFVAEAVKLSLLAIALITTAWLSLTSTSFLRAAVLMGISIIFGVVGFSMARSMSRGVRRFRAARRIKCFKCPHCGYDVSSLSLTGTCPECGGRFDLSPSEWDRLKLEVERRLREREAQKPE